MSDLTMTMADVAEEAERLRLELRSIPDPGMNTYKIVMAKYKRILNDIVVLIRELAKGAHSHPEV